MGMKKIRKAAVVCLAVFIAGFAAVWGMMTYFGPASVMRYVPADASMLFCVNVSKLLSDDFIHALVMKHDSAALRNILDEKGLTTDDLKCRVVLWSANIDNGAEAVIVFDRPVAARVFDLAMIEIREDEGRKQEKTGLLELKIDGKPAFVSAENKIAAVLLNRNTVYCKLGENIYSGKITLPKQHSRKKCSPLVRQLKRGAVLAAAADSKSLPDEFRRYKGVSLNVFLNPESIRCTAQLECTNAQEAFQTAKELERTAGDSNLRLWMTGEPEIVLNGEILTLTAEFDRKRAEAFLAVLDSGKAVEAVEAE